MNKKQISIAILILTASCLISGCAPLLIGAGAVGGYEMATHNKSK